LRGLLDRGCRLIQPRPALSSRLDAPGPSGTDRAGFVSREAAHPASPACMPAEDPCMSQPTTRLERDLLGERAVPADAYYGVQTARALDNFNISGVQLRLYPDLIKALAMVKMAAARANVECGQFSKEILKGIEGACQELIDGKLHDQFRLDMFQGGA